MMSLVFEKASCGKRTYALFLEIQAFLSLRPEAQKKGRKQSEFEFWMRVMLNSLHCPFVQSFQWKWHNRGQVDTFMELTHLTILTQRLVQILVK